jgi:hypothetical protein
MAASSWLTRRVVASKYQTAEASAAATTSMVAARMGIGATLALFHTTALPHRLPRR